MIELDIWQLLVGFVAAMGIPSAVMGLIMSSGWRSGLPGGTACAMSRTDPRRT